MSDIGKVVVLPNRDLWFGHRSTPKSQDNVPDNAAPRPYAKLNEAMAGMLKAAQGNPELTCQWCGFQSKENLMIEHLKSQHASLVEPPTDEALRAALILAGGT